MRFPEDIEQLLDEAYVRFWKEEREEPEECKDAVCLHVSEITYAQRRGDFITGTMIAGLEAEKGLCCHAKEKGFDPSRDEIQFVCGEVPHVRIRELPFEWDGKKVLLIGTVDAFVFIPPSLGGPVLLPVEKKTGHYRNKGSNSQYGYKKLQIAREQGLIYAWLTESPAFVIQADFPRNGHIVTHEFYLAKWERDEEAFMREVVERAKTALRMREHKESWREMYDPSFSWRWSERIGKKNLLSFFAQRLTSRQTA